MCKRVLSRCRFSHISSDSEENDFCRLGEGEERERTRDGEEQRAEGEALVGVEGGNKERVEVVDEER